MTHHSQHHAQQATLIAAKRAKKNKESLRSVAFFNA
jgi:hypothetical protein